MRQLTDFDVLTFDCYGTLIDWEQGILAALEPLRQASALPLKPDQMLTDFGRLETELEASDPTMLYRQILENAHRRLAALWQVDPDPALDEAFAASIALWPAFPDSAAALKYLQQHYKLVILSNVDRDSFAHSQAKLGVTFDAVYTAEDIGSYKPDQRNFDYLIEHLEQDFGCSKDRVLHSAQSLFHDHQPAGKAGLARAWINRRHARPGTGATPQVEAEIEVDFRFPSLGDLVAAHRAAISAVSNRA